MGPLCSLWSILTARVGGVVIRVYKLAPVTYVNLPWTNILPTGIVGEVLHAAKNRIKLNPFKPRCICIARCAFTYSVAFNVASESCIFVVLCRDIE